MAAEVHVGPAVDSFLEANLRAIAARNPGVAERIRGASVSETIEFVAGEDGVGGVLAGRSLGSRRQPVREGARLAESVDLKQAGAFVFLGFGLGHHVAAFARRAGRRALIVVFEPDVALLRATLGRIDHSDWITNTNTVFLTDAGDGAAMSAALEGAEPMLAMGVQFIEHPPSRRRLAGIAGQFSEVFNGVIAAVRTTVVTTMVQTETSMRNAMGNLPHYVAGGDAGIARLKDSCTGRTAIVVSAGPSLQRNIHELTRTGLRDDCVLIAVQTALKPLLARGVKPHFVTALDYHEVSRRFYEGLTASDVEGVTLVVEPKAHPSIANSFPGRVRCAADPNLDTLLGAELAGEHGAIKAGSTVAHLAYYLARHLGCERIVLVGQDLAFTDGQYYSDGAAIHETWAHELNPFTTLEMFEWERIARLRSTLRSGTDVLGRRVYTDEQMWTYHAQFEREFRADSALGVEIIDATEGGLRKAHTTAMTLAEALESVKAAGESIGLRFNDGGAGDGSTKRVRRVEERLRAVRRDAGRIAELSRETDGLLGEMAEHLGDAGAVERLIRKIYERRDSVTALDPAYSLVQRLDQTGAFNRARADRDIDLTDDLDERDRQRRQIKRDRVNVARLAESAARLCAMLEDAIRVVRGDSAQKNAVSEVTAHARDCREARVAGILFDDGATQGDALRASAERLRSIEEIDEVIVLSAGEATPEDLARLDRIRRLRAFSVDCWRGGIGAMTWADEALAPNSTLRSLEAAGCTAAFVVDARCAGLDADLCNRIVRRHREDPDARPVTFSQAAPGRGGMVLDASVIRDIAEAARENSPFACVGGVLRYNPVRPTADPIAKAVCEPTTPEERDATDNKTPASPRHLNLEITTDRAANGGARAGWLDRTSDAVMSVDRAAAILGEFASMQPQGCVTLAGCGDPVAHPDFGAIVRSARDAGVYALHVRTDLGVAESDVDALLQADVVSVDLLATTEETYRALTGSDAFERVSARFTELCRKRNFVGGLPQPWVVARLTRCDAVYKEIESFYDSWTALLGHAVLDPLPRVVDGERIGPLGVPASARRRLASGTMCVRADGSVVDGTTDHCCGGVVLDLRSGSLADGWSALLARRTGGVS